MSRATFVDEGAPIIVATLMLILMLTPHAFWHRAPSDALYQGFDPNLVKGDRKGIARSAGVVEVSHDSLRLVAVPESNPRVRLGSTPKDFNISMDVRIVRADAGTRPLSIDLWQWRTGATYSLIFGPSPKNSLSAKALQGTRVLKEEVLGTYNVGEEYSVQIIVDRARGVITSKLEERGKPSSGSNWVVLSNGAPHEPPYVELLSGTLPVDGGENYEFGATVKLVDGQGKFKLNVFWFDALGRTLGWDPPVGWFSAGDLTGWMKHRFVARAPRAATHAAVVASAGDATYFMTDFFLRRASDLRVNLLANGQFREGIKGWALVEPGIGVSPDKPTIGGSHKLLRVESSLAAAELPNLMPARLDVVWSLQTASPSGTAVAEVQNYRVLVPPQTWRGSSLWGTRVKDHAATVLVLTLFGLGCLLSAIGVVRWASKPAAWISQRRRKASPDVDITVSFPPIALSVGAIVLAVLTLNAYLFHLGYHLIDFSAAKLWSYVAMRYGVAELYSLAAIMTPGDPWTGAAVKQADFPYGPTMAYMFSLVGWLSRMFLASPQGSDMAGSQLGFVLKSVNLLFFLADALMIFLIVRTLNVRVRPALFCAMLFLLNPAVWFVVSIWGETQVISVFFFLLAILFAQKYKPQWTWASLAVSVLSRPQLWVPCLLLGLVCLRRFPLEENIRSIAWGVILGFMLLLPFSLTFGPSFLVNWILGTLSVQVPLKTVFPDMAASLGAYNLWPLVSPFTLSASGYNRMWFSSVEPLIGGWTYSQLSTAIVIGLQLILMAYVLLSPRVASSNGGYLPALAVSLLALLLFRTGISNHHFILALPLLILAKGQVGDRLYYPALGVLTLTTLVSVVGDFAYHMQWKGLGDVWMPSLYPGNNMVTRFFLILYQSDWIITLSALANLLVFLALGWAVIRQFRPIEKLLNRALVSVTDS